MIKRVSSSRVFSGEQCVYEQYSALLGCEMRFAVFFPEAAAQSNCPALFWLSGLTCTEQNFITKSGYQRYAAEHEMIVIAPDTSPRGENVPDDAGSYDFGQGAGFYLDAVRDPWQKNYRMYSYIVNELYALVLEAFSVDEHRVGIFGHSMGGHGALSIHLKNPDKFKTVSAFSPIVAPSQVPWGEKAFSRYLGDDKAEWRQYDSCELVLKHASQANILIDQGLDDEFLEEQLKPELFEKACNIAGQPLMLRRQPGYDHSYYFIATFMDDHFSHHSRELA